MKVNEEISEKGSSSSYRVGASGELDGLCGRYQMQADRRKPAKAEVAYYHDQVGNSDKGTETYDRWRRLFGS
jgi:hypothetical protein